MGEAVKLENLEGTQEFTGMVARINASVNQQSQTVSVFIDVQDERVKEGMYLEAQIEGRSEENAFEISRKLLNDQKELFIVRDSVLDVLSVRPVYFSDKTAVIRVSQTEPLFCQGRFPGAYAGMTVKTYRDTTNIAEATNIKQLP